jgi:hypothetical protein
MDMIPVGEVGGNYTSVDIALSTLPTYSIADNVNF